MIRFAGTDANGEPVLGIGLTREDCAQLLEGKSIVFSTSGLPGLPEVEVCVFAGESDEALMASAKAASDNYTVN